jgi:GTP-binding protein
MRFIDEAIIEVAAGDGGRGCVSFLRSRRQPKGGPDGGDGGHGGHVIMRADHGVDTLADHSYLRHFRAGAGGRGKGANQTGARGEDKIVLVPVGVMVQEAVSGELLADLTAAGQEVVLAAGGRGGKGNRHFTAATRRGPRFAQPGEPGERKTLRLTLKLLADVGLVGLPNAGKSSLLRALSAAVPKVADYPFTTLSPNLGVVELGGGQRLTLADIPGLVAGAHQGAGLGLRFLRHIERTRLFVYVVDMTADNPIADLSALRAELAAYDPLMAGRAALVAANKIDLPAAAANLAAFRRQARPLEVIAVSAAAPSGLEELLSSMAAKFNELPA